MAIVKGPFQVTGSVGELSFYTATDMVYNDVLNDYLPAVEFGNIGIVGEPVVVKYAGSGKVLKVS